MDSANPLLKSNQMLPKPEIWNSSGITSQPLNSLMLDLMDMKSLSQETLDLSSSNKEIPKDYLLKKNSSPTKSPSNPLLNIIFLMLMLKCSFTMLPSLETKLSSHSYLKLMTHWNNQTSSLIKLNLIFGIMKMDLILIWMNKSILMPLLTEEPNPSSTNPSSFTLDLILLPLVKKASTESSLRTPLN